MEILKSLKRTKQALETQRDSTNTTIELLCDFVELLENNTIMVSAQPKQSKALERMTGVINDLTTECE